MHSFYDFKGFKEASLDLFQPLTVLIGPNGSGKSNVIEAVELFSFIAQGRPLHLVSDIGNGGGGELQVRGGIQSCPRHGSETFAFNFSAGIGFEKKNRPFDYYVKVQVKPSPKIIEEKLIFKNGPMIFQSTDDSINAVSGDIRVQYNNFAKGGQKPIVKISNDRSVLSRYREFATRNKNKFDECVSVTEQIKLYLRSSFVFDPNPKLMRRYERIGNNVLLKDGSNLSAVLYGLQTANWFNLDQFLEGAEKKKEKIDSLNNIINWIRQIPQEPYLNMDFVTTSLNDVIFGLKESTDSFLADARLLSDGTLRCLAVLTALETVADHSRVVIEEVDNGLHPSRVKILIDAITSCCESKKLNVLVTTHNPATLNALKPEQLNAVVLCSWDSQLNSFNLIKLNDLPRFEQLMEKGALGDLVTQDILKKHLDPQFEKEIKKKTLKWLENL